MNICPKCGNTNTNYVNEKFICEFCYTEAIVVEGDQWYNAFFECNFEKLEHIEQELYKKYVYDSPEFNQELFDQRRERDQTSYQRIQQKHFNETYRKNHPCCPRCGSEAIVTGQKGFSIWTGFIGSGATVNRCSSCGHKWKPKG